jgi:hypothetical protein
LTWLFLSGLISSDAQREFLARRDCSSRASRPRYFTWNDSVHQESPITDYKH